MGMLRGIGWAVCSLNPASRRLSNHWISLHEHGHVAGFIPILVMDVWEHAYLLDYQAFREGTPTSRRSSPTSIGSQWRSGCSSASQLWLKQPEDDRKALGDS